MISGGNEFDFIFILNIYLVELAETIEKDLHLLGATVVEDKLQDQVPAVLSDFLLASTSLQMSRGRKKK